MRLALVHGFTQSGRSWRPVAALLEEAGHHIVTPDAPGHGPSPLLGADLWQGAQYLAASIGPAVWIGYSMGGRLCLHLALAHPEAVVGLGLVSTTAGIEDAAERAARRTEDEARAARIEAEGMAAFVEGWLRGPLWTTLPADAADIPARMNNTAPGLADSLRRAGTGAQEPLWKRLGEIEVPVMVATGALDTRFGAIGDRLAAATGATRVRLAGAGHAIPWEKPVAFADAVLGWLASPAMVAAATGSPAHRHAPGGGGPSQGGAQR